MNLIIKPTQRCNFACSFCSSTDIAKSNRKSDDLDIEKIKKFLKRFPETSLIIVNGGDPLMVDPSYYYEIIDYLDEIDNKECRIDFTTNLWDWWKKPEKWDKLFKNSRINITTSFNYGETRKITKNLVYTEDIFIQVVSKFKNDFGYLPNFISVISNDNKDKAVNNVKLAKFLGVECKMNYAVSSGRSDKNFAIGDMYNIYLDVYENGLHEWEFSTKQMLKKLKNYSTVCPLNRRCDSNIRNLQPKSSDGYEYGSCGAFGDDRKYGIDFDEEVVNNSQIKTPLRYEKDINFLKEECFSCPMFSTCNGCYKTIYDLKKNNLVEHSCNSMKKFYERAKSLGIA